jgi:uncharacterized protein with PIN domain
MEYKFLADANVGKLARLLRMLGFDTAYDNTFSIPQLTEIAVRENRILLTRNPAAGKLFRGIQSFIVTDERPYIQLKQVIQQFNLKEWVRPFTRCITCNGILLTVPKENIINRLQQNTTLYFDDFWQCQGCNRVFWKGSHYERMLQMVKHISGED